MWVEVRSRRIDTEFAHRSNHLAGERLIDLDQAAPLLLCPGITTAGFNSRMVFREFNHRARAHVRLCGVNVHAVKDNVAGDKSFLPRKPKHAVFISVALNALHDLDSGIVESDKVVVVLADRIARHQCRRPGTCSGSAASTGSASRRSTKW